jgi:hypothetical protein
MISSLTNLGTLRFMIFAGALNAVIFLNFLRRLIKDAPRKVFLIVDNLLRQRSDEIWIKTWKPAETRQLNSGDTKCQSDRKATADVISTIGNSHRLSVIACFSGFIFVTWTNADRRPGMRRARATTS